MCRRAVAACAALLAFHLTIARAQDAVIHVEVTDRDPTDHNDQEEVEKRMLSELVRELNTAKNDALLLYTEYTAKAGSDLKAFLKNISTYADNALRAAGQRPLHSSHAHCWYAFESRLKKLHLNTYKAASFSGDNHHKFLLGHMVVFRMHLNKTEELIRKCEKALYGCGAFCENQAKVRRWKRQASEEIHRVQDDLQHSRKAYKDLVAHAKKRLAHLRKQINMSTTDAVEEFHKCIGIFTYR